MNEIYHGGPVQGRGKSFLENPRLVSVKMPDGSFKELGEIAKTSDSLCVANNGDDRKWNGLDANFSCVCEIPDTPENRKAMRELAESCEKSHIEDMVRIIRKYHRRGHYMCSKQQYKYIDHIIHKHYNMNFSRYCKSIGIKYFTGFRVLLDSGYWVKKK